MVHPVWRDVEGHPQGGVWESGTPNITYEGLSYRPFGANPKGKTWTWSGQPSWEPHSQKWGYIPTDVYTPSGNWEGNTRYGYNPISESVIGSNLWWDKIREHYEGKSGNRFLPGGSLPQSNIPGAYSLYPGLYRSDNPRGRPVYQRPIVDSPGGSGTYNYFSSQLPTLGWITSGGTFNRNPDWRPGLMKSDLSWSQGGSSESFTFPDPIEDTDPVDPVDPVDPIDPIDPIEPIEPIDPDPPIDPPISTNAPRTKSKTFFPTEDFIRDSTKWENAGMTFDEWADLEPGGDEAEGEFTPPPLNSLNRSRTNNSANEPRRTSQTFR